ncbi:orotidine 5'-phosphate decarboxylase / HUMPS family protein [Levilactobacillus bambusae]|uniref:3-hexulose-6-phosphate synthase n=1 Tax=Levilactobacillus bambusae TaxID=2024736 RepID=A0A2V1N1K3_9LACO|nr:orotidine 5'-phosphate decarboxylase / HUMPS family protein [Levilactobacillus bambusae]PWG00180.1 3-hexulose-6-phosphate synthase [Levilactobacillus bambusae]
MKIQAAIDRVTLDEAQALSKKLDPYVDIIELGTSLPKDYGVFALQDIQEQLTHAEMLYDLKTIDEGDYEFTQGYRSGADILTVMGASSKATIEKCLKVAKDCHKQAMIDLMEVDDEKLAEIADFPEAIYCLHHSQDAGRDTNPAGTVAAFHEKYPHLPHIAIAGGVDLESTRALADQGLAEIVIVGSKLVKTPDPVQSAIEFQEAKQ